MNNRQLPSNFNFYGETTTDYPSDFNMTTNLFDDFLASLTETHLLTDSNVNTNNSMLLPHNVSSNLIPTTSSTSTSSTSTMLPPITAQDLTVTTSSQNDSNSGQLVTNVSLITNNQKYPSGIIQDNVHLFFGSHGSSDTYKLEVQVTPIVDQMIMSNQTKLVIQVKRENSKELLKKARWVLSLENRKEECIYLVQNNNFPKTRRGRGINESCLFAFSLENLQNVPEQLFPTFKFQFYSKLIPGSFPTDSFTVPPSTQISRPEVSTSSSSPPTQQIISNPPMIVMEQPKPVMNNILFPASAFNQSTQSFDPMSLFNSLTEQSQQQSDDLIYQSSGKKRKKIEIFEPKLFSINPMYGTIGSTVVLLGNFNILSEKAVKVHFDQVVVEHPHAVTPNTIVCTAPDHEDGNSFVQVVEEFEHFQMKTEHKIFRYISQSFQMGINQLVFNSGPRPYQSPPSYLSPGAPNTDSSSSSNSYNSGQMFYDSLRQNNLHRAAYDGDLRAVVSILESRSCDPFELDNFKRSPFHIACAMGHLSVVQALWTHIVDILPEEEDEDEDVLASVLLYQQDSFSMTPLDLASKIIDDNEHDVIFFLKDKLVTYPNLNTKLGNGDLVLVENEVHERKLNQLKHLFPSFDDFFIREILERCGWSETEAAALVLCQQFESNICAKSSMTSKEVFMVIEKQKAINQLIDFMNMSPFSTLLANKLSRFFDPEKHFENYEKEIKHKFSKKIYKIENIVHPELQLRFSQYINQEENPLIFMTFHGTSEQNVSSIKEHGLLVPGKGNDIRPVNGSEYGLGIYTSFSGTSSIEYCYGGNKMFVCAVCVRDKIVISEDGNVLVVFDERSVLPCWLITFENRVENVQEPVNMNYNNNLLRQI